jgi:peptidoglycan/LPS O-acetylase OafA/YrhL
MSGPSIAVDRGRAPGEPPQTAAKSLRADIQLLRALAILLVIAQHVRLPLFPGGFLGVDIFFVVSGYLMAGLIDEALDTGSFRFAGFYARRARRLLPAAYATLIVTAMVAPALLDPFEYRAFLAQLGGSFLFVVNLVLWGQTDYFSSGADLKPLLHMWSLAVEEQFYLVLPLALLLSPKRWRLPMAILLTAASAILCLLMLPRSPSATFYFLPSRAWELGIGVVVALGVRRGLVGPTRIPAVRLGCAAVLLVVPMLVDQAGHPGLPAALVCLATAVLLLPGATIGFAPAVRPLTTIGDRSYSLYLVHWPVLAFANNIVIGTVPGWVSAALLVPIALWAEAQYRLVEQPLRRFRVTPRAWAALLLIPALLVGGGALLARDGNAQDRAAREANVGFGFGCTDKLLYRSQDRCRSSAMPETVVWGDSFAMHLVQGLAASSRGGVEQATRWVCGPFVGIAPTDGGQYPRRWAEGCIAWNESVLADLERRPGVRTVVLSSILGQYIAGAEPVAWRLVRQTPSGLVEGPADPQALIAALARTVARLRAAGKRVVLFAPPPSAGYDIGRCLIRRRSGRLTIAATTDCAFSRADFHADKHLVRGVLATVATRGIVPILSLDDALCGSGTCRVTEQGAILYRDNVHLSAVGSGLLGRRMGWGGMIERIAR